MKNLLVLMSLALGTHQTKAQPRLSLTQQQQDFNIFRTGINEMQPGKDWFISPDRLNAVYDSIYSTLKENDPVERFYYKLRFCVAALKSAHNGISLPKEAESKLPALPFILRYINEKLYIKVNCSPNSKIPGGSQLVSINKISVKDLTREFLQYCFSNGQNTSMAYKNLGLGSDFLTFLRALHPATEYTVEVIPFQQKKNITVKIPALPFDTIAKYHIIKTGRAIYNWDSISRKPSYRLLDSRQSIGYFKIPTFSGWEMGDNYKLALQQIFDQIKLDKVKNLIVDIRGNGGGDDDVEQYITSYFRTVPKDSSNANLYLQSTQFTQMKYVQRAGNLSEDDQLLDAFLADPFTIVDKLPDGRFKIKSELLADDIAEKPLMPNAFQGKVFLLQNGQTFSAACTFAFRLKKLIQKEGGFIKVIGEENGYDANAGVSSGGYFINLGLPNSKINVWIPIVASGAAKPYTQPRIQFLDYKVTPTPKEMVDEVDVELAFVQKLIENK